MSERTIEVHELDRLLYQNSLKTILDVGCFYSAHNYWNLLHRYLEIYNIGLSGVDLQDCPEEINSGFFNSIKKQDVLDYSGFYPELVCCISAIEHNLDKEKRLKIVEKLSTLGQIIFLTFPFGKSFINKKDNYVIIDNIELDEYREILRTNGFKINFDCFYCLTPNGFDQPWVHHPLSTLMTHDPSLGVSSVGILTAQKEYRVRY